MIFIIVSIFLGAFFSRKFARKYPAFSITVLTCIISLGLVLGLFLPTNYTNAELVLSLKLIPLEDNNSIYVIQNGDWINLQIENDKNHLITMKILKKNIELYYSEDVEPSYRIYKQYPRPSIWSFSLISAPKRTYELYLPEKSAIMKEK